MVLAGMSVDDGGTDSPQMTPSIRIAIQDLGWSKVADLYPGTKRFPISQGVEAVPLQDLASGALLFERKKS